MWIYYHDLTFSKDDVFLTIQIHGVNIVLDEQVLAEALGVPTQGIRSLKNEYGLEKFLRRIGKLDDPTMKTMTKKSLKREF